MRFRPSCASSSGQPRSRTRQFVRRSPACDPRREVDHRIEQRHDFSQRGSHFVAALGRHLAKAGVGIDIELKRAVDLIHAPKFISWRAHVETQDIDGLFRLTPSRAMTPATLRRFFSDLSSSRAETSQARALQLLRPSSPESQPIASALKGSDASFLVSECPHFEHSNARLSKPFGSSETDIVIIRVWHLGQRGRWIGNSSGSGFRMAFALEQAGALHSHSPMVA
jgi:hypothetical protein